MATTIDNAILVDLLLHRLDVEVHTALIIGCRAPEQVEMIKAVLRDKAGENILLVHTCDVDSGLQPDIVHDLDDYTTDIRPGHRYDIVLCSNTLMYLELPVVAIHKLLDVAKHYVILQEPVFRIRPEEHTLTVDGKREYFDRNRFTCYCADTYLHQLGGDSTKRTVEIHELNFPHNCKVYWNDDEMSLPHLSGIWLLEAKGRRI